MNQRGWRKPEKHRSLNQLSQAHMNIETEAAITEPTCATLEEMKEVGPGLEILAFRVVLSIIRPCFMYFLKNQILRKMV